MRGRVPNWRTPDAATGERTVGLSTWGMGAPVAGVGAEAAGAADWANPAAAAPSRNVAVTRVRKLSFKRSLMV